MASPHHKKEFDSWYQALQAGKLSSDQLTILHQLVEDKQAKTLESAAKLLDWQESVIDPDEHMYGF